jgi:SET domain-containing protein
LSPGQELTFDYRLAAEGEAEAIPCACGAPSCRGRLN